jgi:hypothetical protein
MELARADARNHTPDAEVRVCSERSAGAVEYDEPAGAVLTTVRVGFDGGSIALRAPRSVIGLDATVAQGLAGIVVARLPISGGIRAVYPFLPIIAHGLGISLEVIAGLAVAAGESVFVVYGEWLTRDFGMSVARIGASTLLIVAGELAGAPSRSVRPILPDVRHILTPQR